METRFPAVRSVKANYLDPGVEKRGCHPVSNDGMHCQANFGNTPAWTPRGAPFRSGRTFLTPRPRSSLLLNRRGDTRSHHPSLRFLRTMILTSNSLRFREASCPLKGSVNVSRPQNDSGSPA